MACADSNISAGFASHETGPLSGDGVADEAPFDEPLSAFGSTHIHLYSETAGGHARTHAHTSDER